MPTALRNRFLFSHLYLEQLCQDGEHRAEAADLIADLRGWLPDWDDSSLSSLLSTQIEPTLVGLGFHYERLPDDPRALRLYADYGRETALGLCYVAHREDGEVDLDRTVKGRHYAAEIVHALQEEDLSWGLLTDGKRWRLYHADELAPYETFVEIDLERLLRHPERRGEPDEPPVEGRDEGAASDGALLFHLLFRQPAFERDEKGECALDHHLQRSEETAEGIEEHLSDCIEEVLRDLCQGFVERDGKDTYTSDERDEVFRSATVLLYRVLFILYAEARDLLPLGDPAYDPHSLDALAEQAIDYARGSGLPDPDGTELWQDLSDLCSWINSGDDERNIPAYNGDLFDDSDKRYIHDHTVADKYLAPALFSLGCLEDGIEAGYRRIDYRDLSVRHLGSIYEGLLEYKLFIAQERRVRRADDKGGYTFPRLSETRLKRGEEDEVIEVYLAHSAGERKSMGAYYTPEYIVDYIVKQTVRRGLEERRESLEEKLPGWLEEVEAAPPADRARLQEVVDQRLVDFVEQEVLTFRVCDPAMGSGHFLVNAAHTITNFVVETLNLTPWENPSLDANPVTWRRRVAKNCLYGVDLNELAVELAKLSLWLTMAIGGNPLDFYDHHLRPGNSLIGARLNDLARIMHQPSREEQEALAAGQISMYEFSPGFRRSVFKATELLEMISSHVADVAEDVKTESARYEEIRQNLKPYRDLASACIARHFGIAADENQIQTVLDWSLDRTSSSEDRRDLVKAIHKVSETSSFFHWDLEFPRVFIKDIFREAGNDGFDAVVGNPPFGAEFTSSEQEFIEDRFSEARSYSKNSAMYFIELCTNIAVDDGYVGVLCPKSVCYSEGWHPCAALIAGNLDKIVDVTKAFSGVLLEQVFFILQKAKQPDKYLAGKMDTDGTLHLYPVPKAFFENTRTLLVGASLEEFEVYERVANCSVLMSLSLDNV